MDNVSTDSPSRNRREDRPPPPLEDVLDAVRRAVLDALDAHEAPKCLGMDEAADRLGVSRRTLDTLVHADRIQSIKIRRRRVVPVSELERYVERKLDGGSA